MSGRARDGRRLIRRQAGQLVVNLRVGVCCRGLVRIVGFMRLIALSDGRWRIEPPRQAGVTRSSPVPPLVHDERCLRAAIGPVVKQRSVGIAGSDLDMPRLSSDELLARAHLEVGAGKAEAD